MPVANKHTYAGLFLVTLSVLMYEILLTRIFSVIAYYHFAFMAISIAMFGMTIGALLVYLHPRFQPSTRVHEQIAFSTLGFSLTLVLTFLILLRLTLIFDLSWHGLGITLLIYLLIAIPFTFAGICICLVLTKFSRQINTLYAADLMGAGIGCMAVIGLLNNFSGPTTLVMVGVFAGLGAIFFSLNARVSIVRVSVLVTLLFSLLAGLNIALESQHTPLLRFQWVKNVHEAVPRYEKWNAFSQITLWGDAQTWKEPFAWAWSEAYPHNRQARFLWLQIDALAGTPVTYFQNNLNDLDYLKYDVTNVAHYLRPDARVLIIGVGGGRDVLSALYFQQKSILGVEINPNILHLLTDKYADYTGHLAHNPKVSLIQDEARSFVTRLHQQFDIIQMSLIDTWAATASGAYALTENALYTVEAWKIFFQHLSPQGLLTVSRWYAPENPAEIYRLTALASQVLVESGMTNPEQHLVIFSGTKLDEGKTVATLLMSRSALSPQDIAGVKALAQQLHFRILLAPNVITDPTLSSLAAHQPVNFSAYLQHVDISPPRDDRPFFFQLLKIDSLFHPQLWFQNKEFVAPSLAIVIVAVLLVMVTVLTVLCVLIPLMVATKRGVLKNSSLLLIYFASIGLGFMLVEISQMQRLTLFLGYPTYGLSVVLFALLLASGLGSLSAPNLFNTEKVPLYPLLLLLMILVLFGWVSEDIIAYFQASATSVRILVAILLLFPMGICMGFALPMGMQLATRHSTQLTPWLWGINGATSICGSVFAVAIALVAGISVSFWVGVMAYGVAVMAYLCIKYINNRGIAGYFGPYSEKH